MDTPRQHGDHTDMENVKRMTTGDGAPRLITVEEFDKMVAADVFDEDERIELVEGALVRYAPPRIAEHAYVVWHFPEAIRRRLGAAAVLWMQSPVIVSNMTVLEPDLTLLRLRDDRYRNRPGPVDVLAIVEIAVSSLSRDRSEKLGLYAEAGIPEYWVVDVFGRGIETFQQPADAAYTVARAASGSDSLAFAAFPDVVFTVEELLG
jgi:Uma2 family endonuclease